MQIFRECFGAHNPCASTGLKVYTVFLESAGRTFLSATCFIPFLPTSNTFQMQHAKVAQGVRATDELMADLAALADEEGQLHKYSPAGLVAKCNSNPDSWAEVRLCTVQTSATLLLARQVV